MNRAVASAAAAGAALAFAAWRRRSAGRARADLYFGDGSMVSLAAGDEDADRLVAVARDLVGAAHGAPAAGASATAGSTAR